MPKMKARDDWTFDWFYMLTNASVAFGASPPPPPLPSFLLFLLLYPAHGHWMQQQLRCNDAFPYTVPFRLSRQHSQNG